MHANFIFNKDSHRLVNVVTKIAWVREFIWLGTFREIITRMLSNSVDSSFDSMPRKSSVELCQRSSPRPELFAKSAVRFLRATAKSTISYLRNWNGCMFKKRSQLMHESCNFVGTYCDRTFYFRRFLQKKAPSKYRIEIKLSYSAVKLGSLFKIRPDYSGVFRVLTFGRVSLSLFIIRWKAEIESAGSSEALSLWWKFECDLSAIVWWLDLHTQEQIDM